MCFKIFRKYLSRKSSSSQVPPNPNPSLVHTQNSANETHQFQFDTTPSLSLPADAHRVDSLTSVQNDAPGTCSSLCRAERESGWKTAGNAGRLVVEIAKGSADAFLPLKSILGGLTELMRNIDQASANQESIRGIMQRLESLRISPMTTVEDKSKYAQKEIERRVVLEKRFDAAKLTLDLVLQQNKVLAFLNNADDASNIAGLVEDIKEAIIDYQVSLQQDISEINRKRISEDDYNLLEKLPHIKDAGFWSGNRTPCLKGTRVELLQEMEYWSTRVDPSVRPIYWLNGIPGTGKTTIAHTFAQAVLAEGRLGGCFFCSRDSVERSNIHLIFPTIAFQLAYNLPEFRATIVETIRSQPDVGYQSLWDQLTKLIINPLRLIAPSNPTKYPIVIVLDALDECSDSKSVSAVLSLLSHHGASIPSVRIFITSRPEYHIRNIFRSPLQCYTKELILQDVDRATVDRDIEKYLLSGLSDIVTERPDLKVSPPWPNSRGVKILVRKSGGLFIHASTSLKFVTSRYHYPPARLQLLLSIPHDTVYEGKLGIDPLYSGILVHVYEDADIDDAELFSNLRLVMSCVVLAFNPMSCASLATLLGMELERVMTILDPLHSVLRIPDDLDSSQHVTVFHKSFPDYLIDPMRCKDTRFHLDSSLYHGELAVRCFELMKVRLKKNICNLPRFCMNSDIGDLAARRQKRIADALDYACRCVAKHLRLASGVGDIVPRLLKLVEDFMKHQLLPWLEVLSVGDDLRSAIHSLRDLRTWLLNIGGSHDALLDLIEDCERFVLYSFDAVKQSASHIYEFPLQWVPTASPMANLYRGQASTGTKVICSDAIFWDACIRTITMMTTVYSVSFSHKGDLIASGGFDSSGGMVQIFEAATGARIATLNGHDRDVNSIDFSFDDVLLVSGSDDNTVQVWDVHTGGLIKRFEGHKDRILSVVFSAGGTMVVSGSKDKTIRIWDLSSGWCRWILTGHADDVTSVCWSNTRNEVISGSRDSTVKVWDVVTGDCRKTFHEHTGFVESVACSPDGSKFASGSGDKTIRIYDAQTSDVLQTIPAGGITYSISFSPDGHRIVYGVGKSLFVWDLTKKVNVSTFIYQGMVFSVAVSPEGTLAASGSTDGSVAVWQIDGSHGSGVEPHHHSAAVTCLSFTTDGQTIASGSADNTVKVWDAATGSCLHTYIGHSGTVYSIALSPGSPLVASGSYDKTIRVWSTHTGDLLRTLNGHVICVVAVQFSPDGGRIVSQSLDGTIGLWDTDSGEQLAVFLGGISVEALISHNIDEHTTLDSFCQAFVEALISQTTVQFSPRILRDIGGDAVVEAYSEALGQAISRDPSETRAVVEHLGEMLKKFISKYVLKPVFFSANGTGIILESKDGVIIWNWNIATNPEQSSNAFPMVLVPIPSAENPRSDSSPLRKCRYSPGDEWVLDPRDRRVCWIPPDRRGNCYAIHGDKLALGARSGKVSLLDFSGMKI